MIRGAKVMEVTKLYTFIWRQSGKNITRIHEAIRRISSSAKGVSKVPQHPVTSSIKENELPSKTKVDLKLVQLLEKLSLVDFANAEGIARLEEAINLADNLSVVDTNGVEPMISILEDRSLPLADDVIASGDMSEELLGCAVKTLEDYFVVPPGNIDFAQKDEYYHKLERKDSQ